MGKEHVPPQENKRSESTEGLNSEALCLLFFLGLLCFLLSQCVCGPWDVVHILSIGTCIHSQPAVCGLSLELAGVVSLNPFARCVCFRVTVLTVVISKLLFSSHKEELLVS